MTAPAICPAMALGASLARSGSHAAVWHCPLPAAHPRASLRGIP